MSSITVLGRCPQRIINKAEVRIKSQQNIFKKKLTGLPSHYSIRVSQTYRLLIPASGNAMLCSHTRYDKVIRNLQRCGR